MSKFNDQGPPQFSIGHCLHQIVVHKDAKIQGQVDHWKKVQYALEWYWHDGYKRAIEDAKRVVSA